MTRIKRTLYLSSPTLSFSITTNSWLHFWRSFDFPRMKREKKGDSWWDLGSVTDILSLVFWLFMSLLPSYLSLEPWVPCCVSTQGTRENGVYRVWTSTSSTVVFLQLHVAGFVFRVISERERRVSWSFSRRIIRSFTNLSWTRWGRFVVSFFNTGVEVGTVPVYPLDLKVGVVRHYSVGLWECSVRSVPVRSLTLKIGTTVSTHRGWVCHKWPLVDPSE